VVERLVTALEPDDVVLGGGNVHRLKELPPGCRAVDNTNAFLGGFRLWEQEGGKTFARPSKGGIRPNVKRGARNKEHKGKISNRL
jgi:polyphosphate glucokinase